MWVACHRWQACIVVLLSLAAPQSALAYSNFQSFVQEVEAGGGGGRLFTGTPADGFSCGTCHRGAPAVPLVIEGLPEAYAPGVAYELTLRWPQLADKVSLMAEFTDAAGLPAGALTLRPFGEWEKGETCLGDFPPEALADPAVFGPPAADLCRGAPAGLTCCLPDPADPSVCCQPDPSDVDNPFACCVPSSSDPTTCRTPDAQRVVCGCCRDLEPSGASCVMGAERAVLHVPECGATFSRVIWTAPASGQEVWFGAALVQSDDERDDLGDGVALVRRRLAAAGADPDVVLASSGCHIGRLAVGTRQPLTLPWTTWVMACGLVCLGFWRRERRRRGSGEGECEHEA